MSHSHFDQRAGMVPASHQGSWAHFAQAEKVMASTSFAGSSNLGGPTVQPSIFEVGRLRPAWILASSNRPTSPTGPRPHVHPRTRIRGRRVGGPVSAAGKTKKQVRQVRRLDKPSNHAGPSRPTSRTNLFEVGQIEEEKR